MVPWQRGQQSWDAFFKSGAKPWVNILSIGFVWLLQHGGQAPKFLIPESDVVQCRKSESNNLLFSWIFSCYQGCLL